MHSLITELTNCQGTRNSACLGVCTYHVAIAVAVDGDVAEAIGERVICIRRGVEEEARQGCEGWGAGGRREEEALQSPCMGGVGPVFQIAAEFLFTCPPSGNRTL